MASVKAITNNLVVRHLMLAVTD